jgi:hypothetical protein
MVDRITRVLPHFLLFAVLAGGEAQVRAALSRTSGTVDLPAGIIEISSELQIPDGAKQLRIQGHNTIIRAKPGFKDRALVSSKSAANLEVSSITFEGTPNSNAIGLPPYDKTFAQFYSGNGILIEHGAGVTLSDLTFTGIAGMSILVNQSSRVTIDRVSITNSGSKNQKGRNNTTGGILLEEGTTDFAVRNCRLQQVLGNGIWTHSLYTSPRNARGEITGNKFQTIGRDAIQVGHATEIRVLRNEGSMIGYPAAVVDVEGGGTPVGIDTAGNVDHSAYINNSFFDVNGKCIDLDGFHDGEIRTNTCEDVAHFAIVMNNTNPDMQSSNISITGNQINGALYGGIFLIGTGHTVTDNVMQRLNKARCEPGKAGCVYRADEPDMLLSGIYLGKGAERPAPNRGNTIVGNTITGYKMDKHCIAAAPGISLKDQHISKNSCR